MPGAFLTSGRRVRGTVPCGFPGPTRCILVYSTRRKAGGHFLFVYSHPDIKGHRQRGRQPDRALSRRKCQTASSRHSLPASAAAIAHDLPPGHGSHGRRALSRQTAFTVDRRLPRWTTPPGEDEGLVLGAFRTHGKPTHVVAVNPTIRGMRRTTVVGPGPRGLRSGYGKWRFAHGRRAFIEPLPGAAKTRE